MFARRVNCIALLLIAGSTWAQSPAFNSLSAIPLNNAGPVIRAHSESEKPFTVAGVRGVVLGQQNGTFEAWVLPVKLLSHLTIEANIEGYTVPIDVNQQAAEIEVRPDRTIITYSHIGFTVRQIMFSPNDAPAGTGPVVLFEFDCVHSTEFIFRFTPELRWMWPERNEGVPGIEWVAGPNAAATAKEPGPSGSISGSPLPNHGYYVLHADYPDLAGAITIPGAQPGILAPYQERPQVHPVEFHLHIDPARDHGRLFPLLMAAGMNKAAATNDALGAALEKLNTSIESLYKTHADSYTKLLANSTSISTPDQALNEAFQWAVISIEQLKAHPVDAHSIPTDETALVAGYYASGDSARPGFGWFFGRDALYTLFAVNSYGDFSLSKSELEFLIKRQREDGKIMHEYSQTAASIDWRAFPYMYAAADATPLFLLAVTDYVRSSGDMAFLTAHRDAIEKAWAFETGHADTNGIYSNTQGTGWVESWPSGMPHQEVYLAFLDQQASGAMAQLEDMLKDPAKSAAARARAEAIARTIQTQFYDKEKSCYAFSRNADGSLDRTSTVYPALGWWSGKGLAGDGSFPAQTGTCLQLFAGHALNTDWGLRDVANNEKIYDGMSYHQGSVWPLFTGWAAMAEYRGNQPLAGYQLLMENANLTKAQDLGAVTELLSGDYFVPFGRSTSHQLWSSAMVITPTLRGLFGIDIDAQTKTITVNPHLPVGWKSAVVSHINVGSDTVDLLFTQQLGDVVVQIKGENKDHIKLVSSNPDARELANDRVGIQGPGVVIEPELSAPVPGDRTKSFKVISQTFEEHKSTITIEGPAGTEFRIPVYLFWHLRKLDVSGAKLQGPQKQHNPEEAAPNDLLSGSFPPGEGWKTITVTLTW
jgi:glycogen debranching enzyme